jgi:hypothetical protein
MLLSLSHEKTSQAKAVELFHTADQEVLIGKSIQA